MTGAPQIGVGRSTAVIGVRIREKNLIKVIAERERERE